MALGSQKMPEAVALITEYLNGFHSYFDYYNSNHIRMAADALAEMDTPEATDAPIACLKSPSETVRKEAIAALGQKQEASAVAALLEVSDNGSDVGSDAMDALIEIGPPAAPALRERVRHGTPRQRLVACNALGEIGDPDSLPLFLELLDEPNPFLRPLAIAAIGNLRDASTLPQLIALAGHSETATRDAVACALGKIGSPDALPTLETMLSDPEWSVRYNAVNVLREILPANQPTPLLDKLFELMNDFEEYNSFDRLVSKAAIWTIAHIGVSALPLLEAMQPQDDMAKSRKTALLKRIAAPDQVHLSNYFGDDPGYGSGASMMIYFFDMEETFEGRHPPHYPIFEEEGAEAPYPPYYPYFEENQENEANEAK